LARGLIISFWRQSGLGCETNFLNPDKYENILRLNGNSNISIQTIHLQKKKQKRRYCRCLLCR